MLKEVILETANPMSFNIGAANPDELLILTSISGLDPADVTLFVGEYSRDGGYYQGRRVARRNPVFNFKINPNYVDDIDASDARDLLYRAFLEPMAETDGVQVRLIDDRRPDRYFIGYTETFPADIFVQKPTAQISMICVDPFLKSVDETSETNPGGWLAVPISYDGSADSGISLELKVNGSTDDVIITNNTQKMTLHNPIGFFDGDLIRVNTIKGERGIQLKNPDTAWYDMISLMTADSDWIALRQAANSLRTYGAVVGDGLSAVTEYTYRSSWWGV